MHVLVVETTPGAAGEVRERLESAGHTTLGCPGGADCSLVGAGLCPLVDEPVDVVVDVRDSAGPFSTHEQPLVCGILAGVPTVVCGPLPGEPGVLPDESAVAAEGAAAQVPSPLGLAAGEDLEPHDIWHRADVRCDPDGVVDAVAEAALPTSPTVRHRITNAVTAVLRRRGVVVAPFRVAVSTRHGAVDVHLEFASRVPPPAVREQLRVVVRAVLIPVTRSWASATVLIFESAPPAAPADEPDERAAAVS